MYRKLIVNALLLATHFCFLSNGIAGELKISHRPEDSEVYTNKNLDFETIKKHLVEEERQFQVNWKETNKLRGARFKGPESPTSQLGLYAGNPGVISTIPPYNLIQ